MHITNAEHKQKIISTVIVTIGSLLGFQALSYTLGLYQIESYLWMSIYIYAFHVFWLSFLFDLHCRGKGVLVNLSLNQAWLKMLWMGIRERFSYMLDWYHFRHYQNFLILPGVIYWSIIVLLFLNPFRDELKQLIIFSGTLALAVAYWHMKDIISRRMETVHPLSFRVLALVKLFAAFLIYSAVFGVTRYYGLDESFLGLAIFSLTFLLIYQALFQHHLLTFRIFFYILVIAATVALSSLWVYFFWNADYLTGALVMLATYNTLWGMLHHYLDKNLTTKLVLEYLLILALALSILFATHDFTARIS